MKKLFIFGAFSFASLLFANDAKNVEQSSAHFNSTGITNEFTKEQRQMLALLTEWWGVSFTNACGQPTTVLFQSDNEDGSAAFNAELSYAVNAGWADCLN